MKNAKYKLSTILALLDRCCWENSAGRTNTPKTASEDYDYMDRGTNYDDGRRYHQYSVFEKAHPDIKDVQRYIGKRPAQQKLNMSLKRYKSYV